MAHHRLRVLHFYRTYRPATQGGLEEAIRQICLGTGRLGVENRVLTLAPVPTADCLSLPEAEVIRVPLQWEPASCSMGLGLFGAFREQAAWADVIHIHYPWPFADLVHLLSGSRKPVVVTYHSDIIRQKRLESLYAPLRWRFFRQVSWVVATSPRYFETSDFLQSLPGPVSCIPLGLMPESYPAATEEAIAAVERACGRDFFLFVGVLRYYKGLRYLIEAVAGTDLRVVIAGHGPEQEDLKARAAAAGADNVQFVGFVEDAFKQALFRLSLGVVFPSCARSEAFGMTLLEGQLNRKPLISCEIGTGTSYVNLHQETGLVVPAEDPGALRDAMLWLRDRPAECRRMGEAGHARLLEEFCSEKIGQEYHTVYEQVCNKAPGKS